MKKSGIQLIKEEREKQITKHGFTGEHHHNHPKWYEDEQLIKAAKHLTQKPFISSYFVPKNWDKAWFSDLCKRSYKERLIIAGALIAAELDRLSFK